MICRETRRDVTLGPGGESALNAGAVSTMVFEFLLPRLCSVRHLVAKMDKDHQVPSGWQRLGERLCQGASPCSKTLLLLVGRHWQNSLACCRFNSVQTGALTKVDTATGFQFINMPVPVDHLQRRSLTPIRPFATPDPEPNATPGFAPTDNSTPSKAQWSRYYVTLDLPPLSYPKPN